MGFALLLLAAIALATPAAAQTASQCTAQKYKAVGKYAQALAACRSKEVAKGLPDESLCEGKALLKLQKAFEKAEARGDCLGTRDGSFASGETEDYLASLAVVLEVQRTCCVLAVGTPQCLFREDAASCTDLGGTPGPPGSVCDGATLGCVPPPAAAGPCCEFFETNCNAGWPEAICQLNSGVHFPSAACTPADTCEP